MGRVCVLRVRACVDGSYRSVSLHNLSHRSNRDLCCD